MNSAVNYGLSGLGWPPWSILLSVLAHELSSYFLRFVDMTCTLYGLQYGTLICLCPRGRLYYLVCQLEGSPPFSNLSSMRSAISSSLTGLDGSEDFAEYSLPGNPFAHTPNDKHGSRRSNVSISIYCGRSFF